MEEQEKKRELARLKRLASDVASEIHDIVEDTYWTEYGRLAELSQKAKEAVEKYRNFKTEHGL